VAVEHLHLCLPSAIALSFEDPHRVSGDRDLFPGRRNQSHAALCELEGVLAICPGTDDLERVIPGAALILDS